MTYEILKNILMIIIMAIAQITLCGAAVFLILFLRKMSKKIGVDTESEIFKTIESLITTMVVSANQKVVDAMKAANPDGKLTEAQQEEIFNMVKTSIIACLSDDQVKCLINRYGNVDAALSNLIEEAVNYNHAQANPVVVE